MSAPEYLIFKLKDQQHKCLSSVNPFYEYVQPSLCIMGRNVRNATKSKNDTLLFEFFNEKQADNLLMANLIDSHLMHVERHVFELIPGNCNIWFPGWDLILTCWSVCSKVQTVTSTMHVGYEQVPVRPYIWTVYVAARARSLNALNRGVLQACSVNYNEFGHEEYTHQPTWISLFRRRKDIWELQGNTFFPGCPANLPQIQAYARNPFLCIGSSPIPTTWCHNWSINHSHPN
jgi:hypothetical protein